MPVLTILLRTRKPIILTEAWPPPPLEPQSLDWEIGIGIRETTMNATNDFWRQIRAISGVACLLVVTLLVVVTLATCDSQAGVFRSWRSCQGCSGCGGPGAVVGDIELSGQPGVTWYWIRSPEEEKRVMIGLYNRYCIRCHGVDGRGIWDIPNVPDFTNARWQASRSEGQLARAVLEGRGACMPPFRGTLTLEEGWAMGRYLRTFVPGTEVSPPNVSQSEMPVPRKLEGPSK
jgi:hypothetical protein